MESWNGETREAARLDGKHGAKHLLADKTKHHLTDQSCRKLLGASSSLPRSLKMRLTRHCVSAQRKSSLCTCRVGRKTTLFASTAHANMQMHTDCTSDARVSMNSSVLARDCQSHFRCICCWLKFQVTETNQAFFRIFNKR